MQKYALHDLKYSKDFVITKADKGGQFVLLDKSSYVSNVDELLK